jgi:hypothetical protein
MILRKRYYFVNFKLSKAGLIIVLLHEIDHFNKRVAFSGKEINRAKTPKKNYNVMSNDQPEGGFYFIKSLFGAEVKRLSLEQAEFILDLNNWKNCCLTGFCEKFRDIINIKIDAPCIRLIDTSDQKAEQSYCYIAMNRLQEPKNSCY